MALKKRGKHGTAIVLDDSIYQSKIKRMARKLKLDETTLVREQGALYARDMAKYTPPYAGGNLPSTDRRPVGTKGDKETGEKSIDFSIRSLFVVQEPGAIATKQQRFGGRPIYVGKKRVGAGVAWNMGLIAAHHNRYRDNYGRTYKIPNELKYWVTEDVLFQYITSQKAKVGMAKAAPSKAMMMLNPKQKAPAWISRHIAKVSGSGTMTKNFRGPIARIRISARGLQHLMRHLPKIKSGRLKAMETQLYKMTKAAAKKSGFKVR